MRVLLDECLPHALRRELKGHAVLTVQQAGWSGFKNGRLLAVAETEFDVFITIDANMPFEQQLDKFDLAFIILHPPTSKVQDIVPFAPLILVALPRTTKGHVTHIPEQTP